MVRRFSLPLGLSLLLAVSPAIGHADPLTLDQVIDRNTDAMGGRGHQLELAGQQTIDGIDYYAIAVTMKDGFKTTLYPTPTVIEQKMSDFRQVGGVWFPFANTETDLKDGKLLETTTVKEIHINPPIQESIFSQL